VNEKFSPDLLADENFRALLKLIARKALSWDEFLALPQPSNISPLRTWELLNEVGACLSVPIHLPDLEGNIYAYRRTHELEAAVLTLSCGCRTGSRLDRMLSANSSQPFLKKSRIAETIAAAQLDGLAVSEGDAKIALGMDRAPQTATEQLLLNTLRTFEALPGLADERFSPALFHHFRDLLLQDVKVSHLRHARAPRGLLAEVPDDGRAAAAAERGLQAFADYLNGDAGDPSDLPVLRALMMGDAFQFHHPLGIVSNQVGRLAGRLFAVKNGLPVLGLLPLSRARIDWENGEIRPPDVTFNRDQFHVYNSHSPMDSTAHQTIAAQLALVALRNLESKIETWERRDEEMRAILHGDPLVNHRQRTILARALRNPEAEFRIRYHQRNHNIHYTTARRDLLELQEKGYLHMEQHGKAFVFTQGPRLEELTAAK
jgi:hypothetical protein